MNKMLNKPQLEAIEAKLETARGWVEELHSRVLSHYDNKVIVESLDTIPALLAHIKAQDSIIASLIDSLKAEKRAADALERALRGHCTYCIRHYMSGKKENSHNCERGLVDGYNYVQGCVSWQFDYKRFSGGSKDEQ